MKKATIFIENRHKIDESHDKRGLSKKPDPDPGIEKR